MNKDYVENLERPNNDQNRIRYSAKDLVSDKTFSRGLIEYSIKNFLEATQAYYDDFDSNKLYFQVNLFDETISLCFDVEYLAHIFGFGNYKYLKEATIINYLLFNKLNSVRINSSNWLDVFKQLLIDGKEDIIDYDSNPLNEKQKKLNWDKISEKLFCFLNLGILSESGNNPTIYYREDVARGTESGIVIVKDVISKNIKGQIYMRLDYDEVTFKNGRKERMLVPISIEYVENEKNEKKPIVMMNGKRYRFGGKLVILQVMGGSYGRQ